VLRKVAALEDDPRPPGATRLVGADDLWRIRIGDYRVVYAIEDGRLLVPPSLRWSSPDRPKAIT
jgi:mRNA interferase RelE/StbE